MLHSFVDAVRNAASREELVPPTLSSGIKDAFEHKLVVAGQAGFFLTNLIRPEFSQFTPVVHLPNRSADLVNAILELSKDVYVFDKDSKSGLAKLTTSHIKEVAPPIHIVLEYPADLELKYMDETFTIRKANRFIFTYDPTNMELHLDEHFLARHDVIDKSWIALVSGFHLLEEHIITDEFREQHRQLVTHLRDQTSWFHFELAYSSIHAVREFILRDLMPKAHSIGLNEIELGLFAEEMDCFVPEDDHSTRLKRWYTTLSFSSVILFHCFGAYIALDTEGAIAHEKYGKAFDLAEEVIINSRSVMEGGVSVSVASEVDHAGIPGLHLTRALVPTAFHNDKTDRDVKEEHLAHLYAKTLKPISSTVGLGDTISSSIAVGINM